VLSGQEAINLVCGAKQHYDIIFMDHMMPGMDGIEATRKIKNEINTDYAKNVPVIALTANALSGNEEMFLKNGFSAFISKPIDIMRLDKILNQFIRDKQSGETLQQAEEARLNLAQKNSFGISDADENDASLEIPAINGLDTHLGIERYSGAQVFEGILRSYMTHTPALLKKLKTLSPGTLGDYAVTVHGLKSASYGIFAQSIGKQAEELEALSKAGAYEKVFEKNDGFIHDAETLVANITNALKEIESQGNEKEEHNGIDPSLLEEILDAAQHFKTKALDNIVAELKKYSYTSAADAEMVNWLYEQVENLEYDAIVERLKKIEGN
jgi:CheY-like chemotaxis protein